VNRDGPQILGAAPPLGGLGELATGSHPVRATLPPAIAATAMPSPPTMSRMVTSRWSTSTVGARLFEISSELAGWTDSTASTR